MPLFGSGNRRVLTVNGRPQPQPEVPGSMSRKNRLFTECARRLADDSLAASSAEGRPIGDGHGLEGLVAKIAPLFEREQSLIRWVALRGAFASLFVWIADSQSAVNSPEDLEAVMGLDWEAHDLVQPWRTTLTSDQKQAAIGVASSVLVRLADYNRYSKLNIADVNADPLCQIPRAAALDCIAWSAVALLRLRIIQQTFTQVPEPDALSGPDWYTDPLFAKAERYWDGSDWTARCRVKDGRQYIETSVPLA